MLFKFIFFDIKNGLLYKWKKVIFLLLIPFGIHALFLVKMQAFAKDIFVGAADNITYGDDILNLFCGMKEYHYTPNIPFIFPALWIFMLLFIAYLVASYPAENLQGIGKNMMALSGNRTTWWLSKSIWLMASIAAFFMVIYVSTFLFALAAHQKITTDVSEYTPLILDFSKEHFVAPPWNIFKDMLSLPLVLLSICFVQMTLSLFIKPLLSFLVVASIIFLSAYFQHPLLIGNYAMLARSAQFADNGLNFWAGIFFLFFLIGLSYFVGWIRLKKMDIF